MSAIRDLVAGSQGQRRVAVLLSRSEFAEARQVLRGTGVQLVVLEDLRSLRPAKGEAPLQAYGRLYMGTTRIRVLMGEASIQRILIEKTTLLSPQETLIRFVLSAAGTAYPEKALLQPIAATLQDTLREILREQQAQRRTMRDA
jgi:hypothetical protein